MRSALTTCLPILVLAQALSAQITTSEYDSLQSYFSSLHGSTFFPVDGGTIDDVESSFGPRIQSSTDNYDFHRGIDIDGTQGDNILAVADGVFWEYREFSGGGHTVILRHEFDSPMTLNGTSYNYYYTYYMHLYDDGIGSNGTSTDDIVSSWTAAKTNGGVGTVITAGQHIGEMGNSGSGGGDAYADHLHMEVRVGTTNSLEYQNENPQTTQHGFDPHLHPLLFLPPEVFGTPDYTPILEQLGEFEEGVGLTMQYSVDDESPLLNRFEINIVDQLTDEVVQSYVLDFNLRTGYDHTTLEELDTQNTLVPYIDPQEFGDTAIAFTSNLVLPEEWLESYLNGDYRLDLSAYDIWDNETALSLTLVPEPGTFALLAGLASLAVAMKRRR